MLGHRESLREFIRNQDSSMREFIRRETGSLQELIRGNHEELVRHREKQEEEFRLERAELHRLREAAEAQAEETREFNREILLRNEKVYKTVIAEMEEGRKQIRANTEAVLNVLDRLNGSGGIAA
jgi:hypothetical protein